MDSMFSPAKSIFLLTVALLGTSLQKASEHSNQCRPGPFLGG